MKDAGMIGTVYSMDYVNKHILKMNDADIEKERENIATEIKQGVLADPNAQQQDGDF